MNLSANDPQMQKAICGYLIALGDDRLVLGHRLSEWCGHAPMLEEDIAITNISLDCIGQAAACLKTASDILNDGRTEDDLAYFRDEIEFTNLLLLEQPNGDFAKTIIRQVVFDAYSLLLFEELKSSALKPVAELAAKFLKEVKYHFRHSSEWTKRLGGGTEESRRRTQSAVNELWRFTGEMFETTESFLPLAEGGFVPDNQTLKQGWEEIVFGLFDEARISIPENEFMQSGGRSGYHTEHLGHILSEMQIVARSHPGAEW